MSRDTIQLDPDKVKLQVARSGLRNKQLLPGMSAKTVHRIKAGQATTRATAHKLAEQLGTTVENLMRPVTPEEMRGLLPGQWLYDEAPASADAVSHRPFWAAISGGAVGYLIGPPPIDFSSPLEHLRNWHRSGGRKIVLRQDGGAFVFEIHCFDYSPDRQQRTEYWTSTACRFFPLARHEDVFSKTQLSGLLHRYVWRRLRQEALDHAEIVAIEGDAYPTHPYDYFPLVRFYRGTLLKRVALGARMFGQLHVDLKWSMKAYVDAVASRRVRAQASASGISLTIDAIRPASYTPGWEEDVLQIGVDLVWRTGDGKLAVAPWRKSHRVELAEAISGGRWDEFHLRGMPIPRYPDSEDDEPDLPPFAADPDLSDEMIGNINAIDWPIPYGPLWNE